VPGVLLAALTAAATRKVGSVAVGGKAMRWHRQWWLAPKVDVCWNHRARGTARPWMLSMTNRISKTRSSSAAHLERQWCRRSGYSRYESAQCPKLISPTGSRCTRLRTVIAIDQAVCKPRARTTPADRLNASDQWCIRWPIPAPSARTATQPLNKPPCRGRSRVANKR